MEILGARILPRNGKYYGTEIEVEYKDSTKETHSVRFKIWCDYEERVSKRELDECEVTSQEEYLQEIGSWDHVKGESNYLLAELIVNLLKT